MKIGILGGTFDPPHIAHLHLAQSAIKQFQLDEVFFIPTYKTPNKLHQFVSQAKIRLKLVDLLIQNEEKMSVSNIEITRGGTSYTIDTLEEMMFACPGEYWLIMGSDTALTFPEWKQAEKIAKMCRFAINVRHPHIKEDILIQLPNWMQLKIDWVTIENTKETTISAAKILDLLARGITTENWLKPEVLQYIKDKKLYTELK